MSQAHSVNDSVSYLYFSEAGRRTTRPVARTREPEWRQTVSYSPITKQEFQNRSLEVTVWNLKKNSQSEFLGEVRNAPG